MFRRWLVRIGALLLGCIGPDCAAEPAYPYSLDIDQRLSPVQRDVTIHAFDSLNAITNPGHQISLNGGHWRVAVKEVGGCSGWAECEQDSSRTIWLSQTDSFDLMRAEALHGMGHMLGWQHTCDPSDPRVRGAPAPGAPPCGTVSFGVMDPIHADPVLNAVDRVECRRVEACD